MTNKEIEKLDENILKEAEELVKKQNKITLAYNYLKQKQEMERME